MWRRLYTQLRALAPSRSHKLNRLAAGKVSSSPSLYRTAAVPFSRQFASDSAENFVSKKRVEDVMPIATGHEREELEAEIQGRKVVVDIDNPEGPFGTKVSINYN
ncbi:rubredoxin-like superfamily protein [Actinidia rufa]|uniref:Rubredoxin-like superfamily protein n=1 Tax=Actinidia rufa TaxID=165716 RepID=A0A7J0FGK9_9ERIC|nr:rubredoxin-like superfamily protein [Actinidia rufa]